MNSIYNEDITMTNKNKQGLAALSAQIIADAVREIVNNANITGEQREFILEAAGRLTEQNAEIKRLLGHLNPFGDAQSVEIASLQAGLDSMSDDVKSLQGQLTDWQDSCISATAERDRLRVREAELEAKIDLLDARVRELERCVVQNALDSAMLRRRDQEESTEKIIFHAGRVVQNEIDWERHNDETSIENGEL
jgi:chromosome segregation ATPase